MGRRGLRSQRVSPTPDDFQILACAASFQVAGDDVLDTVQSVRVVGVRSQEQPAAVDRDGVPADQPTSARFRVGACHIRDFDAGFLRTRFHIACRTRTVWQCRSVPSLSGLLPSSLALPRLGRPSLRSAAATAQGRSPFVSARIRWRLVAHVLIDADSCVERKVRTDATPVVVTQIEVVLPDEARAEVDAIATTGRW